MWCSPPLPQANGLIKLRPAILLRQLKPLRNLADYQTALTAIEALWSAPDGSPEAERLEVLALLGDAYEQRHFPIEQPDPITFLEYVLETRGLEPADLEPFIGSPGKVAAVMKRQLPLSFSVSSGRIGQVHRLQSQHAGG